MTHEFSHKKQKQLSDKLISWYRAHSRDLPWRRTREPYKIWLSEIMLQQTTVQQGTAYYLRFLKALPTIESLAKAPLDQVLKLWEGLGYYSRARNLHAAAQHIYEALDGKFPDTHEDILKLKGVGPYTAAAIASFVYNLPHAVVDGNVLRVMSRLHGIEDPVDLPATKKQIHTLTQALLSYQSPDEFNQAIMEFGALNCTYKNPGCATCPFKKDCQALKQNIVSTLPRKSKKIKKRSRYFHFFLITDPKDSILIYQRKDKDVWQGLYAFPLTEVKAFQESPQLPAPLDTLKLKPYKVSEVHKQTLSHQYIHAKFHHYKLPTKFKDVPEGFRVQPLAQLSELAFPRIVNGYLEGLG